MCEFCLQHGEGEKWYLHAKNYSEDLLSDLRRRKLLEKFADPRELERELQKSAGGMYRVGKMPWFIRGLFSRLISGKMKKVHFGQVVPLEDIERIFQFTNSIIRVSCICRQSLLGQEKRYCYGVSINPNRR